MADWSADNNGVGPARGQIPASNVYENVNENYYTRNGVQRENSVGSSLSSLSEKISLEDGNILSEESRTDNFTKYSIKNGSKDDKTPSIPPRQPSTNGTKQHLKPLSIDITPAYSIIEDDITIPNDACLYGFTADQMSTFFKHLKVNDRVIAYMHKKKIDGKKFSTLKDSELDNLGINNPIVCFFREKSKRKKAAFML